MTEGKRPLRHAFLLAYLCGFLWYCGNCYWVRDTMSKYGDMPAAAPVLLMMGFSAVLGLYFGLFGLGLQLIRRATGNAKWALIFAPVLWVALELAAARITSVPWDQLGYSQVDNGFINQLAPVAGVYGISFLIVAVNSLYVWTRITKIKGSASVLALILAAVIPFIGAFGSTTGARYPEISPAPRSQRRPDPAQPRRRRSHELGRPRVGPAYRRVRTSRGPDLQGLHRRNPANRRTRHYAAVS